ncbi:bactofilin family protein [Serratia sp. NPDC078593]|uniref:bactofilin family protein n=1 Tax=unclassified Serratia (in: enterobacteria) TaxID=2647522 RepID=UPI0037CD8329
MEINQSGKTKRYNRLWYVWSIWALLISLWMDKNILAKYEIKLTTITTISIISLLFIQFIYILKKKDAMQLFSKPKKKDQEVQPLSPTEPTTTHEENTPAAPLPLPELMEAIKPVKAIKDTFISQGAQLSGTIEGQGNIIVEGKIEGNLTCSHQVRIEPTGHVNGEIRAQHIMINGSVEGRCYSDTLTIQPKGHMRGDIFTDEFSIEKGGVFVGQSQLMQQAQGKNKITQLKTPRNAREDISQPAETTQQAK